VVRFFGIQSFGGVNSVENLNIGNYVMFMFIPFSDIMEKGKTVVKVHIL
jgi:hypothetical protein